MFEEDGSGAEERFVVKWGGEHVGRHRKSNGKHTLGRTWSGALMGISLGMVVAAVVVVEYAWLPSEQWIRERWGSKGACG